jgi:hypothetical protein
VETCVVVVLAELSDAELSTAKVVSCFVAPAECAAARSIGAGGPTVPPTNAPRRLRDGTVRPENARRFALNCKRAHTRMSSRRKAKAADGVSALESHSDTHHCERPASKQASHHSQVTSELWQCCTMRVIHCTASP